MNQQQMSSLLPSSNHQTQTTINQASSQLLPDKTVTTSARKAIDRTGWNHRVDHALDQIIRSHVGYQPDHSIFGDINRMFDATLSTLILIASGDVNISEEHLLWSEAFLRGVRDRYGKHPPNVRKLLGFVKHLQNLQTSRNGERGEKNDLLARTYQDALADTMELTKISPPKGNTTV